ncbi:hypothetical protein NDU88_007599 [Pleurodeles waltl]|uniref:Uncharacterized protein n=1 Tax=Pleurodeles waltl TaxID=8319 RepID=A0AAV7PRX3_PLEWA|nr:hypothetical protein NDU88_007599 [Pleurodeles waltl]
MMDLVCRAEHRRATVWRSARTAVSKRPLAKRLLPCQEVSSGVCQAIDAIGGTMSPLFLVANVARPTHSGHAMCSAPVNNTQALHVWCAAEFAVSSAAAFLDTFSCTPAHMIPDRNIVWESPNGCLQALELQGPPPSAQYTH